MVVSPLIWYQENHTLFIGMFPFPQPVKVNQTRMEIQEKKGDLRRKGEKKWYWGHLGDTLGSMVAFWVSGDYFWVPPRIILR